MNLSSSFPDALTSRAPVLQRIVALTHSGVPTAVTTPRAQRKLSTPAMQKMIFFCWLGMTRKGFGKDKLENKDLCEHQVATAPSAAFITAAEKHCPSLTVVPPGRTPVREASFLTHSGLCSSSAAAFLKQKSLDSEFVK